MKYSDFKFDFIDKSKAVEKNPLSLAFVGDAVYTLYIRTHFCLTTSEKINNLHKDTTKYVKAKNQSIALENILPMLNDEELDIVRRARNTKVNTIAKHATLVEYKKSTSFEALIGYLYLTGQTETMWEVLNKSVLNFEGEK